MNDIVELTLKIGCPNNCKCCPQNLIIKKYKEMSDIIKMSETTYYTILDRIPEKSIIEYSGWSECFLHPKTADFIYDAANYNKNFEIVLYTTLIGGNLEKFQKIKDIQYHICVVHCPDDEQWIYDYNKWLKLYEDFKSCNIKHNLITLGASTQIQGAGWEHPHSRAGNSWDESLYKIGSLSCNVSNCRQMNNNMILPNGDVYLCCMDMNMNHKLGNIVEQTWEEIHNIDNPLFKDLIDKMNAKDSLLTCRKCFQSRNY